MSGSGGEVAAARSALGVGPDADQEVVRRAFRALSLQLHPDAGGDPDAFAALVDAYELLRALDLEDPAANPYLTPDDLIDPGAGATVLYDAPPRRVRTSFQQLLRDAVRRGGGPGGSNGPGRSGPNGSSSDR